MGSYIVTHHTATCVRPPCTPLSLTIALAAHPITLSGKLMSNGEISHCICMQVHAFESNTLHCRSVDCREECITLHSATARWGTHSVVCLYVLYVTDASIAKL